VFDQHSGRKWSYLVEAYRASLHRAGFKHTLAFEMVDEHGAQLWLMFGTSSPKGVEKMKDAMWAVDPAYGVRYRDPRDPAQMMLDIEPVPDTAALERMLHETLSDRPRTLDNLRRYALLETMYRPQQVWGVMQRMVRQGRVLKSPGGRLGPKTTLSLAPPIDLARTPEQLGFDL
jgi:hypothetical protein